MPKNAPDVTVSHEKPPPRSAAVWWLSWSGWGYSRCSGWLAAPSPLLGVHRPSLLHGPARGWLSGSTAVAPVGGPAPTDGHRRYAGAPPRGGGGVRTFLRYSLTNVMEVPVREYSNAEYPENPAAQSVHHGKYNGRMLTLVQKDATHFDFILTPKHPHIAKIVFRDVDVSLMTPGLPAWTKADTGLRRIALTDRQWSRQQVRFDAGSPHVEVTGGNGFEQAHLFTAELAKTA